jgi:DNA end-binding protein Ku
MKSIWRGAISFGMVNIPVKLFSAVERRPVTFHLLHEKDHSLIEYRRWCVKDGKEVPWEEVVKGVEVEEGSYYVFTKEELANFKPRKSSAIEIAQFVHSDRLDRIYIDQHYYVGPDKPGEKAFFLFKEALAKTGNLAIGSFVMREREYVCAIEPYGPGLLLSTLNYEYEIRNVSEITELREGKEVKKAELELAEQLVEKLSVKEFDITQFRDTYEEKLKAAISGKGKKRLVVVEEVAKATKEENLMDTLKASLHA